MKKFIMTFILFLLFAACINAQTNNYGVTLYTCERYDANTGRPIGVGSTFTTGYITIVATTHYSINFGQVFIQFDKIQKAGNSTFYKKFSYMWPSSYPSVVFYHTDKKDLSFDSPGYYRIFLLNSNGDVIAYTTITIVDK